MKWIKQNLVMVVTFAVFVVLLGVLVWGQQQAARKMGVVESELDAAKIKLQGMLQSDPFPSTENVNILQRDNEHLREEYDRLQRAAHRSMVVPELSPVEFLSQLGQTVNNLVQRAKTADVVLPSGGRFAFGLEPWLAVLAPERKPVLHALTQQLLAIEALSKILIDNKIEALQKIAPPNVDVTATEGSAYPTDDPKALYWRRPFDLQFICTTEILRDILNDLARSEWFFVVRSMEIDAQAVDLPVRQLPMGAGAVPGPAGGFPGPGGGVGSGPMAGAFPGAFPSPEMMMPPGNRPPAAFTAPGVPEGPAKRNRLIVSMKLDLIEFPETSPEPDRRGPGEVRSQGSAP